MEKWTWIQVVDPWQSQWEPGPGDYSQVFARGFDSAHFRTFDTAGQASADLRTWLRGEGDGQLPGYEACAALLTSDVTSDEFMLWNMEPPRAWLVFRVPSGVHPAAAGAVVHKQWKPQAHDAFVRSSLVHRGGELQGYRPGVWTPGRSSAASPAQRAGRRPDSVGGGGGCAAALVLIICAIVFLLF
ncbi:hypothetical protein [Kitasatospora viridis]|uniref:hypothetical protein n=1 Tax=Kitasatospora viridis TaxID=281105 RepID=UPI0011A49B5E|nr:hypothetical protein [Kitasatospora viridis]